jgi:hypothetical protein
MQAHIAVIYVTYGDNLGCQSLPSTLFEALASFCCCFLFFVFFFFVFFFATMVCARLAIPQAPKESPVHIGIQG